MVETINYLMDLLGDSFVISIALYTPIAAIAVIVQFVRAVKYRQKVAISDSMRQSTRKFAKDCAKAVLLLTGIIFIVSII